MSEHNGDTREVSCTGDEEGDGAFRHRAETLATLGTYTHDAANRLSPVTDWNTKRTAYNYDDVNRMTSPQPVWWAVPAESWRKLIDGARVKRWWNATSPPHRLMLAAVLAGVVGCYGLIVGADPPLALLAAFTVWGAACPLISDAPNYASWNPTGRLPRFIKGYVDVAHSIRYGRGKAVLRISVLSLIVALAVAATVWTVAA
jgi:hypothetical protein